MRVLAITALAFSAAVFASQYCLPFAWLPAAALLLAAAGGLLFARSRPFTRGLALALCGAAFGLGCFWLHGMRTTVPASRLAGETRTIRAQITDWPQNYERYTRAAVRLHTEGIPALGAYLYDNDGSLADARPGQWIETQARLRPADTLYGERYDGYHARDIYLIASAKGEIRVTEGSGLRFWPRLWNRRILSLTQTLFPEDVGAFAQALMLGDKTGLYRDPESLQALSRAGLMHVAAVSGMHIAYLIGFLQSLFGRSRRCTLGCLALVWLFVLVTGAAPSALRAGVMQSLLLFAPLVRRENDPLTSLSAALALLLMHNPHAAAGAGLQLSFASLAGILCFTERMERALYARLPRLRDTKAGRTAVSAVVNSLSVLPFTVPLMCLHFGALPLLAPLANLLVLWLVSLCFCGAYLACAAGLLFAPLGSLAGSVLAWGLRAILFASHAVAAVPFAAVYLESREVLLWLALCYALFLGFRFVRGGAALRLGLPALLSLGSLVLLLTLTRQAYAGDTETIAALDVGQGQCLAVLSGDATLLIDCGGLGTTDNAGETAGRYLLARGRRAVDTLVLTHLDADHCNGVATLLAMCPVRQLLLPAEPRTDNGMLAEIERAAALHATPLRYVSDDSRLRLGGIEAQLFAPQGADGGNGRELTALVSLGDYDMLVTGDLSQTKERELLAQHPLRDIELYIVGHHGSAGSSSEQLLRQIGADTAIVSCGYNTYGHPAPETLRRLAANGVTVYRTDENGSLEIRMERDHG